MWTFESKYFTSIVVHLDPWGHYHKSHRVGIVKLEAKSKQERDKFYENCQKGIFVFWDIGWNECQ